MARVSVTWPKSRISRSSAMFQRHPSLEIIRHFFRLDMPESESSRGVHKMRNKSKSRPDHSNIDWRNTDKSGQDFRKYQFYRARFEFSTLKNCNFSAVSAKHSCFIKANLSGSDFTGANLEGANFGGADLTNVNFKSAVLSNTNFEGAVTEGASFVNASIKTARKLKLSESQIQEIESAKQAQKAANAAARDARQATSGVEENLQS